MSWLIHPHTKMSLKKCLFFIVVLTLSKNLIAQTLPEDYITATQRIIELKPTTYAGLDEELKKYRYDTILMNDFLAKTKKLNYPEGQSFALNQLGRVYRNTSKYKRSLEYHKEALTIAQKLNNVELEVFSLNMIGVTYRRTDSLRYALDYSQQARVLAESVEEPTLHLKRSINVAKNSIGNLYQWLEQYEMAIEEFKSALQSEADLNNKLGLAINNQNIGDCYEHLGELDTALNYYRKSLAYNEEIKSVYGQVICKNSIAQIYLKQNKPQTALTLLTPLVEPITNIGDNFIISTVHINLGWANGQLGDFAAAYEHLNQGLRLATESNIPNLKAEALSHFSELAEKTGNYRASKEYLEQSYAIEKSLLDTRNIRYINDILLRYEAEKKDNEILKLASESEIYKLQLRKNHTSILIGVLLLTLLGTMLFILYRQYKSNSEKKVLSLEQNMLRSQMNPHFLFNSLNSIKLYIINNDQKKAVHYLNKFSKLIRRILEGSSMKEIALDEELETVELYLNIENIRFNEEINYEIQIEEGLNPSAIKIPSLILQPFLENAIWHGLSPKEGEKNLWITVSKKDDYHTEIRIKDNGVGRSASEIAKQKRVLKRKSVGIDITKERLANFSRDYQNDFDITISDLFDQQGVSTGTQVVLKIPTI